MRYRTYIRKRKSRGRQEWLARLIWEDVATQESGGLVPQKRRAILEGSVIGLTISLDHDAGVQNLTMMASCNCSARK